MISQKWRQVPGPVKSFLLKAIILFAIWKVLYLLILLPQRILDKPLTDIIGAGTAKMVNLMTGTHDYYSLSEVNHKGIGNDGHIILENASNIYRHQNLVLAVADVCNGLELMVLYAGLIICLPAATRKKAIYISIGIVTIFVLNVLRCAALVLVFLHLPEFLDFFHHYLFSLIVYGFIFWLWYLFTKDMILAKNLRSNATIR